MDDKNLKKYNYKQAENAFNEAFPEINERNKFLNDLISDQIEESSTTLLYEHAKKNAILSWWEIHKSRSS